MASFSFITYVSDTTGNTYQRKQLTEIATLLGNTVEARDAHPRLPSYIKPRYGLWKGATTGQEHRGVIGDVTNPLYTTPTGLLKWIPERGLAVGEDVNPGGTVGEAKYKR